MIVRRFNGTTGRIVCDLPDEAATPGAISTITILKRNALSSGWQNIWSHYNAAGDPVGGLTFHGNALEFTNNAVTSTSPTPIANTTDLIAVGVSKAAGTNVPAFFQGVVSDIVNAITTNGGGSVAGMADATGGTLAYGSYDEGDFLPADVVAHGHHRAVMTLQQFKDAVAAFATSGLFAAPHGAPVYLHEFGQNPKAPLVDLVGLGAAQVSEVGTTAQDDTPDLTPQWTYDGTGEEPDIAFEFRLSGGAANADLAAAIGGAMSSVDYEGVLGAGGLFPDLASADYASGVHRTYRLIYVSGDPAIDADYVASVTEDSADATIEIGVPAQAAGVTVTAVANETTAPGGVTFGETADLGTIVAGSFRGLWIRRSTVATTPVASNPWEVSVEATAT